MAFNHLRLHLYMLPAIIGSPVLPSRIKDSAVARIRNGDEVQTPTVKSNVGLSTKS